MRKAAVLLHFLHYFLGTVANLCSISYKSLPKNILAILELVFREAIEFL